MERYDYLEAIKYDIKDYVRNNHLLADYNDREELEQHLNDVLWMDDSVTGNGSGSYTFNSWKAEEYLCHNLDLLEEALAEFGCDKGYLLEEGAEAADVTIRCYLLGQAIPEVLDELIDEDEQDEAD